MFTKFQVQLTLLRDQLGTNPCDPNVHDKHIIGKERKLILEESQVNKEINKYLDAIQISAQRGEAEVNMLIDRLEKLTGVTLTDDERKAAVAGDLKSLKETLVELKTTGTTIFFWDKETNKPCIGSHMINGFLKAAAEAIGRAGTPRLNGLPLHSTSYTQSLINQHVRCEKQFIPFDQDLRHNEDGSIYYLQRSLRAKTPQGERVCLAKSEAVPAGAKLNFTLKVMSGSPLIKAIEYKKGVEPTFTGIPLEIMFSYGELVGLGQWRSSGAGMFSHEIQKLS
jgi:hypothetical protein